MYRIKKNIPLKTLEKYGYTYNTEDYELGNYWINKTEHPTGIIVDEVNRYVNYKDTGADYTYIVDNIKNLIADGLVEEVKHVRDKRKPKGLVISRDRNPYFVYGDPIKYVFNLKNYLPIDDYIGFNESLDIEGDYIQWLYKKDYSVIIFNKTGYRHDEYQNNPIAAQVLNYYIFKNQFPEFEITGEVIMFRKGKNNSTKYINKRKIKKVIFNAFK